MKKPLKNIVDTPVTVTELTQVLENYPTKDDLKNMIDGALKPYVTKKEMIGFKDEILHEIKGLREEVLIVVGYKDQIEDHEKDIDKLKKAVFSD